MADTELLAEILDPDAEMLVHNKRDGYMYRERRQEDWLENYTLSRDKVVTNRLTQRQSVNLPLMKTHIKSLLKDVDDMPVLYFENLDNDKEAEIFKNEYWKYTGEHNKFEIQDIVDKKQVFHFGRSFDQWQIIDGKVSMTVQDPQDILVARVNDPTNINSSRFLDHSHIFVPLSVLEMNKDYDQTKVRELKQFYATEMGLIKLQENQKMLTEKNRRMADMGLQDVDSPILGETYVELSLQFVFHKEKGDHYEQIWLFVMADDMKVLMKKPLEEIIDPNKNCKDNWWRYHYPYNTWADDIERQDFWSDGIADILRTANKVLNAWYSQLVENRTLRSFGMHYYDATKEGFNPQTFQPMPFGWYGMPGKPSDILEKVDIPDLSDSIDEMRFVLEMAERATGASSQQQGMENQRTVTLGEVQLMLGEAKERIKGMSKFYTQVWKERGETFIKLIEASHDKLDAVKVYKKGKNTDNIYGREIMPHDWMTEQGYRCKVWSRDEKDAQSTESLQKWNAVKMAMPDNPKVDEIYKRKIVEFAGANPDETNEIMEFEQQKREALLSMVGNGVDMPGLPPGEGQQPVQPPQPVQIPGKVQ